MKPSIAVLLLIIISGCAKKQRHTPPVVTTKAHKGLVAQKANYTLDWSIEKDGNILVKAHTTGTADQGLFHFVMQKDSDIPGGIHITHRLEVFRTRDQLFTRVDGSPTIQWSSFVDEDKALWNLAFGDVDRLLQSFESCYYLLNRQVHASKGACKPDFTHPDMRTRELKKLWQGAQEKSFDISGSKTDDGVWTDLAIKLTIGKTVLSMHLSGKPAPRAAIQAPTTWISDRRQRPQVLLQHLKGLME